MTRQYLWDQPKLRKFDVEKMVDVHRKKGSTVFDACRFVAEEIFVKFKGPKVSVEQVQNRYMYLKSKRRKVEKDVLDIAENPKVKEMVEEIERVATPKKITVPSGSPIIWSKNIVDMQNNHLNLNAFAYSLIDGEKLARGIQKLYYIQQRRHNKIQIKDILESLASFFCVKESTFYSRYHSNLKKLEKEQYVAKLEKDNVKALKAQLEIMTRSEKQERSFHLSLKDKVEKQEKQLLEQGRKIKELQEQTIIEYIKMKINLKMQQISLKKIWGNR